MNNMRGNMQDLIMSEQVDKLVPALSAAQAKIENVNKNKQGHGYKYADLAACLEAIKTHLIEKQGFAITQLLARDSDGKPTLTTLLLHNSGQWLKSVFPLDNYEALHKCNKLQQIGAALTYLRRYTLAAMVGLAQEDDDAASLTIKKEEVEQRIEISPVTRLRTLCSSSDLDLKAFTSFHHISSDKLDTVNNAVSNFESLKQQYLDAQHRYSH